LKEGFNLRERELKDEIINFVIHSPDESNSRIATFIAGMQAQKSIEELYVQNQKAGFNRPAARPVVRNK
jgi:hypothetical protein